MPARVVVCSFHTPDPYYAQHAERLRATLDRLGIEHVVETVEKQPAEDWADICRRKVGFVARVCEEHPDARVFWIDVDCSLLSLPDQVAGSTADLVGFQRGFGSPLGIGYGRRTRFWEPCFLGIAPTPMGRAFIERARDLEERTPVRATDDYFFEEAWRALCADLTFQVIPSVAALHRAAGRPATPGAATPQPFFVFGTSGQVADFKDVVVQHAGPHGARTGPTTRVRGVALRVAKRVERSLPRELAARLRRRADGAGVTRLLTGGDLAPARLQAAGVPSRHRQRLVTTMVVAGQRGDAAAVGAAFDRLSAAAPPAAAELAARQAAEAFLAYAERGRTGDTDTAPLPLAWWVRPFPGNFGDWLSPLLVARTSGRAVRYHALTGAAREPHLVAVGSVGRFVKPTSVVVGTGVSSLDVELDPRARYHSVRGPLTAQLLRASGGPAVECFGDPAVLLRRVLPLERRSTNGRLALVRHFTHLGVPLQVPEDLDELSVLVSHPSHVEGLLGELAGYDGVVTSAMHVMIACHSYGIPCALVTFEGLEETVHGSGVKYRDYALGAGVEPREPRSLPTELTRVDLRSLLHTERVHDDVLDRVEAALAAALGDPLLDDGAVAAPAVA